MQVLGLPILIECSKFQPGTSMFIPCLDRREVERFIKQETSRLKLDVVCKQVIENKVYGLRVWRVDGIVHPHSPLTPVED